MTVSTIAKKLSLTIVGVAMFTLGTGQAAQAAQVGASAFGAGAIVESFEGLSAGPNISSASAGYLQPGVTGPYTFASGATLTAPIPNPGIRSGIVVGDFAIGNATFGLIGNGAILSDADLPDGSAYIAIDSPASEGPIEFTFASPVFRVGAFVTSLDIPITLSAYDISNALLESISIPSVSVANWKTNFLGLENTAGIAKVKFNSNYLVLDKLTFESNSTPIPTPALLPGLIGLGLGVLRKRKATATKDSAA